MKTLKIAILITILSLTACKKTEDATDTSLPAPIETTADADKKAIETVVKDMYLWNEKRDYKNEFEPVVKGGFVVGYNMESHKLFLQELRDSGFFAEEFITNIDKIVKAQSELLSSGKLQWEEGDMGPFTGDVNAWCGCQDEPAENAYTKLKLHFENIDTTTAKFYWNWEGFGEEWAAEHYNMRIVKEGGKWKIAYMQGWDYNANLGVE